MKGCPLQLLLLQGSALFCLLFASNPTTAQIVPDATLPNNSTVQLQGTTNLIEGGTTAGGNLFHSFQEFSVPTGGAAFFNNALDIQNIFSRVTGSSISNIDGLIRANGAANLFLLNPNGIIFGPNARLNIDGSFLASTASSFKFADGTEFSATNPQAPSLLTINVPVGLQFGANPGTIVNRSRVIDNQGDVVGLQVPLGQTIALVGGDVSLEGGRLTAPEGRIELGSVTDSGLVGLISTNQGLALDYQGVSTFKDIQLSQRANASTNGEGGGDIQVQGSRVTLTDGSVISALTLGAKPGGTLTVKASESVEVIGTSPDGQFRSTLITGTFGAGNAGNLTIEAGRLIIKDGARVDTSTRSAGNGGNLTVRAAEVEIVGTDAEGVPSRLFAQVNPNGTGNGGNLIIEAGRLIVADKAQVSTSTLNTGQGGTMTINTRQLIVQGGAQVSAATTGLGQAGNLTVIASDFVELLGTAADNQPSVLGTANQGAGDARAGNLTIETGRLSVQDGARVDTSTFGAGNGGDLTVRAAGVELIGTSANSDPSGLFNISRGAGIGGNTVITADRLVIQGGAQIINEAQGTGDAGNLTIQTRQLVVRETRPIIGNRVGTSVSTSTSNAGKGGTLTINTGQLIVEGGAQVLAATAGLRLGGTLNVTASDFVELTGTSADGRFSALATRSQGAGDASAGDLNIETGRLSIQDGARLDTSTLGAGDAGNITIRAERLSVKDGARVSTSTFGAGNAGDLTVRATEVELIGTDGNVSSRLSADVADSGATGNGGNITIEAERLSVRDGARVSTSTLGAGNAGNLTVRATKVELSGVGPGRLSLVAPDAGIDAQAGVVFPSSLSTQVESASTGFGGNVTIEAERLTVRDGAKVSASTLSQGDGGNVIITTRQLTVQDGGQILAVTSGAGNGGTLNINAFDSVELIGTSEEGTPSGLLTSTTFGFSETAGTAGDVIIKTGDLIVRDGAVVDVGSQRPISLSGFDLIPGSVGTIAGRAGNLQVKAGSILLDNQGSLGATTGAVDGGNITLQGQNSSPLGRVVLRRESQISATAGNEQAGGNGGNIRIDTDNLVALENSDITANAFEGSGGRVQINTQGIFGTQFREAQTPLSDITASSTFGVNGTVEINTPDVDPTQGLIELPANLVDASNQFVSACPTGTRYADNEFFITGRGGIPPGPRELLGNNAIGIDWVTPQPQQQSSTRVGEQRSRETSKPSTPTEITEAQGWVIGAKGEVILTAAASTPTPHSSWHRPTDCRLPHSASQR